MVLLLIPAVGFTVPRLWRGADPADAEAAREVLRAAAWQAVQDGQIERDNGAIYAVDVAQLATYAALAGDRELFDPLREIILEKLLVRRVPGDPAHGMVAWRYLPEPPHHDASGTTEALRAAEALWAGQIAFGTDDRDTVALIMDAYLRHAAVDNGVWMIRNYFNLHPEVYHFVTNSFLVDYDPDLMDRLAQAYDRPDWAEVAEASAALIERARTPAGLLHQMIRPEVATIMPAFAAGGLYSINGVEQLSNVLTVAERCTQTNPEVSQAALRFSRSRMPQLRLFYDARTGRRARREGPVGDTWAGVETWGPLLRLAVKLGDERTEREATAKVIRLSRGFPAYTGEDRLYLLSEALLALEYAVQAQAERNNAP